ncbi:MAG: SGNH/GDSL hydrolase family protein [Planctomycetota bacterium]
MDTNERSSKPLIWVRKCLLLIGVFLIFAIPAYVEFYLRRPVGVGPAGPKVPAEPFQETWTHRRVLVLGLGDSITRGLGADKTSHTFFNRMVANPNDEWPDMRGKCLSRCLPNLETSNLAVSGSTSLDHEAIIDDRLEVQDPSVFGLVVMTSGGNDLIHSYGRRPPSEGAMYGATLNEAGPWIESFETRLESNLANVTSSFPGGCLIFIADIYDPTDGVGDAPSIRLPRWRDGLAIHQKYNEVIRRVAESMDHVHLVPLHETFLGHGAHCRQFWRSTYDSVDPHYWFFTNIEDPNDRGYDAIRRIFLNEIIARRDQIGA